MIFSSFFLSTLWIEVEAKAWKSMTKPEKALTSTLSTYCQAAINTSLELKRDYGTSKVWPAIYAEGLHFV